MTTTVTRAPGTASRVAVRSWKAPIAFGIFSLLAVILFVALGRDGTSSFRLASGNDFFAIPYIRNSSGLNAVSVAMTKNTIVAYSGGTLVTVGSYTPGRWYAVRVVISTATQTFDLYLDGALVLDNSAFRNPLTGVAQIDYYANSSNYGSVVIDDVAVTVTA